MKQHDREVVHSHQYHDWETPPALFEALDHEFHFDVDVGAQKDNALCPRFISPHQDALDDETHWGEPGETVYVNPPYGRYIGEWIAKARDEQERGVTVVMLLPVRTDTVWFHEHVAGHAEVRFLKGRLKFRFLGEEKAPAPFPSMIVIFHGTALA